MSSEELRAAVESLRSLAPRLNQVTDDANAIVRDVEHFLNEECSLGVHACVNIKRYDADNDAGEWLEYRRVGPRYRIAFVVSDEGGNDVSVKAWSDCPRQEKLQSFAVLPALLAKVAASVEAELKKAEDTAKAVSSTLAVLRKPVKRPTPPSAAGNR